MNKPKNTRAFALNSPRSDFPYIYENKMAAEFVAKSIRSEVIEVEILPVEEAEAMRKIIEAAKNISTCASPISENSSSHRVYNSELFDLDKALRDYDTLTQAKDEG